MALLEVKGLTKHFGGLRAVHDFSFQANPGEILGLIGPNGAGKTTAFNLISGFIHPTAGHILLDGDDLVGMKPYAVTRRGVARTFQIVKPFKKLPVLENVALAAFMRFRSRSEAETEARSVLERMGLGPKLSAAAADLTLSEQKRLEMARALATRPKLLLLDEPMSGLNATEIDQATRLVIDICKEGVTVIWVEHVLKAIMNASHRVVVISQGQKIADSSPHEVVNNPAVISAYLGKRSSEHVVH
jgi:branched-chain amino acid transport system ATP-binding protein